MAFSKQSVIRPLYGDDTVIKFVNTAKKYDPNGLFMNTFGERVLQNKNTVTSDWKHLEHCALTDVCFCRLGQNDCGKYTCTSKLYVDLNLEFRICQPPVLETSFVALQEKIIDAILPLSSNVSFVVNELNSYGWLKYGESYVSN